jgi:predicted nucleic acid-binding protein
MVLDSSAGLDIVLDTEPGRALHAMLLSPEPALVAPGLLWVEVGRVLRTKAIDGALTRRGAEAALADFLDLGVQETQVEPLLVRAWQPRANLSVDDAVFVALAEATAQPLLTTDVRLAGAAHEHARVAVVTHLDAWGEPRPTPARALEAASDRAHQAYG